MKYGNAIFTMAALFTAPALAQQGQRYLDPVFSTVVVTKDIRYGQATHIETGKLVQLDLDLYEPEGDTLALRPAIVWAFPNFRNGTKDMGIVVDYCTRWAKHGYVAVAHNFRNHSDPENNLDEAIQQGYEDTKAAIRWLRANWQTYGIDTLRISVGGNSAGGYTSLATAYMEPEGNSGNPGHSSEVSACFDISATLQDKNDMEIGEAPLAIVHGTEDDRVPYSEALALEQRALEVGIPYELHPLEGVGHQTVDFVDDIFPLLRDFNYKYVVTTGPNGPPAITIDDASQNEGDSGTSSMQFTVHLSEPTASGQAVRVAYSTADGSASAASDYQAVSDTLEIPAGAISGTITVLVNGDTAVESDEEFAVNLQNPDNARITDLQALGTILDDENQVPPAAPGNLIATAVSSSQIDLSWADQADNESGFKIERKTGAGSYSQIATVGANVTVYTDAGLSASTTYTYRVRAYNSAGNSGYSNEASATTQAQPDPPAAPTDLTAQAQGASRIDLSWTDNSNDEDGFKIERKTGAGGTYAEIATVGANVTSYSDQGLSASTTYVYRVLAYNAAGNSDYSNEASATTDAISPPAAPGNLTAQAQGASRIDLSWTDNSNDEDGFKIERKTGAGGTYAEIATVGANVTSYSDQGLSASTTYVYRVLAYNAGGNSAYSNEASATTQAQNQAPAATINQPVAGKTYEVGIPLCFSGAATDPEDGDLPAANYEWRADLPNGVTNYLIATGVKFGEATPSLPGDYTLKLIVTDTQGASSTTTVNFSASSSAPANQAPVAVADALPTNGSAPLQVQFTGSNSSDPDGSLRYEWDFGDGDTSDVADPRHTYSANGTYVAVLTVVDDNCATDTAQVTIRVGTPPAAPGGLTASEMGPGRIDLSWTDNSSDENGFKIERKITGSGVWAEIAAVGANVVHYSDTALASGIPYFYRVFAFNDNGNSDYSNEAGATIQAIPPLQLTRHGSDLQLSWAGVADADSYVVYRATRPMFSADTARLTRVFINSYTDAGILGDPELNHFYRVRAFVAGNPAALSTRQGEFEFDLLAPAGKKNNFVSLCLADSALVTAADLAARIGPSCDLVSKWNEGSQAWGSYIPGVPSTDFALDFNEVYMVSVTVRDTLCLTGEVPTGHHYTLITTNGKNNNGIMLLMDKDSLATASALAADIGPEVDLISRWSAGSQAWGSFIPGAPSTDFAIHAGMPLMVSVTSPVTWPSTAAKRSRSKRQPDATHVELGR